MTFTLSQNPQSPISHGDYLITRLAPYLALIMIAILIPLRASAQLSNFNNPETTSRPNIEAQPNSAPNPATQPALRGEINRTLQSDYRPSAQDYTDLSQAAAHPRAQLQRGARLDKLSTLTGFNFQRLDLDFHEDDGYSDWIDGEELLDDLLPLRDELMQGDYRVLYLAWLKAAEKALRYDDIDGDALEPVVPPGLAELSFAQQQFVALMDIDPLYIQAAAATA